MKLLSTIIGKVSALFTWFKNRSLPLKIVIIVLIGLLGWFSFTKISSSKSQKTQYQTSAAEKGTLITSVSASGNISNGSMMSITTQASGIVSSVYVKNGDTVTKGQKIADVELDQDAQQRQAQAWSSYLSAQNSVNSAKNSLYSLQSSMYAKWKTYMDISQNSTYQNPDGSANSSNRVLTPFTIAQDDWLSTEAIYKNQQNVIAQTQASLSNAWYSYQQVSPTITAPAAGTISGLSIAVGIPVTSSTSTSNSSNSTSTQKVGTIALPAGSTQAVVSLSEVDAVNVKAEQNVTITMTAYPNKTFTGKVAIVDTNGSTSSNVTTYPATIVFDNAPEVVYPNMAVDAKIITNVKDNVILVPSAAVSGTNGESIVRVMKNGTVTSVTVETGLSSDTQTEIVSGVNEDDTVVTGSTNNTTKTTSGSSSIFGSIGGRATFGGGQGR
jgi:membrane fusion protein, macrolide-specific efflux system